MDEVLQIGLPVTGIVGFLAWMVARSFTQERKIAILELRLQQNTDADGEGKRVIEKLWVAIEKIQGQLHQLDTDLKLIIAELKK